MTKPFNIPDFEAGAKPVFRNGKYPDEVFISKVNIPKPVIARDGNYFSLHYIDGKTGAATSTHMDLLLEVPDENTVTMWVNVYEDPMGFYYCGGDMYATKENAEQRTGKILKRHIGAFPITITEKSKP